MKRFIGMLIGVVVGIVGCTSSSVEYRSPLIGAWLQTNESAASLDYLRIFYSNGTGAMLYRTNSSDTFYVSYTYDYRWNLRRNQILEYFDFEDVQGMNLYQVTLLTDSLLRINNISYTPPIVSEYRRFNETLIIGDK